MSGSRVGEPNAVEAMALLQLPDLDGLSDQQTRGTACAFDGIALTPEAVDLGERLSPLSGSTSPMRWFPRACRRCVHDAAYRALFDHAPLCEQCVDNAAGCDTAVALRRLMREYRR